jgi:DNA-binding FadR family transcriptional regulator
MSKPSTRKNANERPENEKAAFLVVKRIREAILDEVFKPGDHLVEVDLAEKFEVSRSPVREALLALEKEGTAVMSPYKGAILKPCPRQKSWTSRNSGWPLSLWPSNQRTVTSPQRTLTMPTTWRSA